MAQFHIFTGKGGVGKSTCSTLEALKWQKTGKNTLLDSMDPAHNLHDIFQTPLGDKGKKILDGLTVRESDTDKKSREYMTDVKNELKGVYHYQQALNIDKYFSLLKYAPGMEEYAALLLLQRCFEETKYQQIVIDTPPTALTLKMLALPGVNLHWINYLKEMREEIINKKNTVANIRRENMTTFEEDPVFRRLLGMQKRYDKLQAMLQDKEKTEIVIVLNEDELSLSESLMIKTQMESFGLTPDRIILNKYCEESELTEKIIKTFAPLPVQKNPLSDRPLTGIDALEAHLKMGFE